MIQNNVPRREYSPLNLTRHANNTWAYLIVWSGNKSYLLFFFQTKKRGKNILTHKMSQFIRSLVYGWKKLKEVRFNLAFNSIINWHFIVIPHCIHWSDDILMISNDYPHSNLLVNILSQLHVSTLILTTQCICTVMYVHISKYIAVGG